MSNDYYNASTTLTRQTLARAETVNTILAAIAAGFDKLPGEAPINEDRVCYAADTGSADTYTVALNKTLTSYTAGLRVVMKVATTNTGACTLNVDSVGARSIKLITQEDPEAGDLTAGDIAELIYDGTNFILMGPYRTHLAGIANNLAADLTFSGNPAFTGSPDFSGVGNKSTIRSDLGLRLQSSANDATSGAVLNYGSVGVFGGSGAVLTSSNDLDTVVDMGIYSWSSGNEPANAPFSGSGAMRVWRRSSGLVVQDVDRLAASFAQRRYRRHIIGSTPEEWSEDVHQGSLLGTCAYSSRVTGSAQEEGSGSGGEYERFANGLQICRHNITLSYASANILNYTWTYEAAFASPPWRGINLSNQSGDYTNVNFRDIGPIVTFPTGGTTAIFNLYRTIGASGTWDATSEATNVEVVAIGRWR